MYFVVAVFIGALILSITVIFNNTKSLLQNDYRDCNHSRGACIVEIVFSILLLILSVYTLYLLHYMEW